MMYKIVVILFLMISRDAIAQRITVEEYIEQYKDIAISEMIRTGVPASITLAQGIHETENGNSDLVKRSNNHFGIKCKNNWNGDWVSHDDDANGECFRAYPNATDSYRDHSDFLRNNKRYSSLFRLKSTDYEGWARGLKKAGYATNPRYPAILIKYVEQYNLQQYSLAVINESTKTELVIYDEAGDKIIPADSIIENVTNEDIATDTNPDNILIINKTKCVFVKKGVSLLAIASRHKISLHKLLEFNDLVEDGILSKDQYLFLHKKPKTGSSAYCLVKPGETLYDIAQQNGVQLKSLIAYNNLNNDGTIQVNTRLYLQPERGNTTDQTAKSNTLIHQVAAKEGLYTIARKYKVTVQQLKEWNKLESDDLQIGQEIIVSK